MPDSTLACEAVVPLQRHCFRAPEAKAVKPLIAFTLARIRARGYIVKEFHVNGTVEFHAVPLGGEIAQVARCNDGDDDESAYKAACMLAQAVGLETGVE